MIIVGVDGSRAGLEAAGWAAGEAALRETPLRLVHAMPDWACKEEGSGRLAEVARWMREGGKTVLAAAEDRVRRERPKVAVETGLLPGDPRAALIEASGDAELVVVGDHGMGGVRGLLVGSVALGVAGHAECDVVLVRELPVSPRDEVVAGVDGSATTGRVLDFAFREAELRGLTLRAVHAWSLPQAGGILPPAGDGEQDEVLLLKERLAAHRERHPGVQVIEEVVHGHPVAVLREAAAGAELLVVGSRGYGTLKGMVLGSVSQAMVHHAPCPLAVVKR
ncbi:universal stress protein [Nonomuraea muscovyensis]|uniref:universal stress protein n=1 Tax=Nonomuraea muscovyensis TaxID=1124761 RepID=UPI0033D3729D|nr:universal stress protein UspA [Nonomuraea muscovyensis]